MSIIKDLKSDIFDCIAVIEQYTVQKNKLLRQLNVELQKEKDGQGTSVPDSTPAE